MREQTLREVQEDARNGIFDRRTIFMVPTGALAQELFADLSRMDFAGPFEDRLKDLQTRIGPLSKSEAEELKALPRQIDYLKNPVSLWRGVSQPGMCEREAELAAVIGAGLGIEFLCAGCPKRSVCKYQGQRVVAPVIVIAGGIAQPIAGAFRRKGRPHADRLVIDETSVDSFVTSDDFSLGALDILNNPPPTEMRLHPLRALDHLIRVRNAVRDLKAVLGPVGVKAGSGGRYLLFCDIAAGETPGNVRDKWQQVARSTVVVQPAPDAAECAKLKKDMLTRGSAAGLHDVQLWNAACRHVENLALAIVQVCDSMFQDIGRTAQERMHQIRVRQEKTGTTVSVKRRSEINPGFADIPVKTILDASAEPELLEPWFLGVTVPPDQGPPKAPPGVHITQVFDTVGSRRKWVDDQRADKAAVERNFRTLVRHIKIAEPLGPVGVVTFKPTAERLARYFRKQPGWKVTYDKNDTPGSVDTGRQLIIGHFGNIRGVNRFEAVRTCFVAGRLSPAPGEVERLAAVVTGKRIKTLPDRARGFDRRKVKVRKADGSTFPMEREFHPDPIVELMRDHITVQELLQAFHRCRPLRRTLNNPVDIFVIGSTDFGMRPHEVITSKEFEMRGSEAALAAARWGMVDPADRFAFGWLTGMTQEQVRAARRDTARVTFWNGLYQDARSRNFPVLALPEYGGNAEGNGAGEGAQHLDTTVQAQFPLEYTKGKCAQNVVSAPFLLFTREKALPKNPPPGVRLFKAPTDIPDKLTDPEVLATALGVYPLPRSRYRRELLSVVTGLAEIAIQGRLDRNRKHAYAAACLKIAQRDGWMLIDIKTPSGCLKTYVQDLGTLTALTGILSSHPDLAVIGPAPALGSPTPTPEVTGSPLTADQPPRDAVTPESAKRAPAPSQAAPARYDETDEEPVTESDVFLPPSGSDDRLIDLAFEEAVFRKRAGISKLKWAVCRRKAVKKMHAARRNGTAVAAADVILVTGVLALMNAYGMDVTKAEETARSIARGVRFIPSHDPPAHSGPGSFWNEGLAPK
jgi:hypothetical protein